jgi:hypothetical protein
MKKDLKKIKMGVPLCKGRKILPLQRVGSPSGLGLRPRAATARCRFAAGPGSTALLRGLQSPLTLKTKPVLGMSPVKPLSDSERGRGEVKEKINE